MVIGFFFEKANPLNVFSVLGAVLFKAAGSAINVADPVHSRSPRDAVSVANTSTNRFEIYNLFVIIR